MGTMGDGDGDGGDEPKIEVIILGCGGGPREDNTTAFLVRSTAAGWSKGSLLAVDAGTHLAAITRILEQRLPGNTSGGSDQRPFTLKEGPFKGLEIPNFSAAANAGHIIRTLVDTYLITHPHLDHISGFVVNTSSLPGTRPKRLAGLPTTINAFKEHIFNNVIWPNLSDENNGAGLITYMRLVEGGSPALGDGDGKGYMEICEGLSVKTLGVSHGHCIEKHSHRGSNAGLGHPEASPRLGPITSSHLSTPLRANSSLTPNSGTEMTRSNSDAHSSHERICVYDSSAYFIRDITSGREVLIFGDVEPDSISLSPRNQIIWGEAAPKIVTGSLAAIFIECSYDDSRAEDLLFGHMAPRYIVEEMKELAAQVRKFRKGDKESKKRKRISNGDGLRRRSTRSIPRETPISPRAQVPFPPFEYEVTQSDGIEDVTDGESSTTQGQELAFRGKADPPLSGVKIVIIHMKEKLDDGPAIGDIVLKELLEYEEEERFGCEFVIAKDGDAMYF